MRLAALSIVTSLVMVGAGECNVTGSCQEPLDKDELLEKQKIVFHWSYLLSKSFRKEIFKKIPLNRKIDTRHMAWFSGERDKTAAKRLLKQNGGNLCPTIYKSQSDFDRIPDTLIQAVCLSRKCLVQPRKKTAKTLRCRKVYAYTSVLKRAFCENGTWTYSPYWEPVAVACACNLRRP